MKRFLALFIAVVIAFCFSGCDKYKDYPIEAEGAYVSAGVYAYYINEVFSNHKKYKVDIDDSDAVQKAAQELCKEHIAVLSYMKNENILLNIQMKNFVADGTDARWDLFSEHYKQLGIEKSDITKIMTVEASKKQLVQYFYGTGGKREVSEDDLKQSFVELYVGFKAFEGDLTKTNTKGEVVMLSDSERENVIDEFRKMRDKVNDGVSIDKVYETYCKNQGLVTTGELQVSLMKEGDPMYDDTFFDDVSSISHGWAGVIISEKTVYLVERCTIATNDEDAFAEYRTEILEHDKMPAIEKKITSLSKKYNIEIKEKISEKIYKAVYNNRQNQL